jgi:hypothetical protein
MSLNLRKNYSLASAVLSLCLLSLGLSSSAHADTLVTGGTTGTLHTFLAPSVDPPLLVPGVISTGYEWSLFNPTIMVSALEFDISSIPSGATISSAGLRLRDALGSGTESLQLYGYQGNGTITDGDMSAGSLLFNFAPSTNPTSYNVTSFIQSLVNGTTSWAGFNIRFPSAYNPLTPMISESEIFDNNFELYPPQLTVEYTVVPEPSTWIIFGLGLVVAIGWRGRSLRRQATAAC